jgi:hypothetical protein
MSAEDSDELELLALWCMIAATLLEKTDVDIEVKVKRGGALKKSVTMESLLDETMNYIGRQKAVVLQK